LTYGGADMATQVAGYGYIDTAIYVSIHHQMANKIVH